MIDSKGAGEEIYSLMQRLWPICRSITGNGVRETLSIIAKEVSELKVYEVPTGEKCFDWTVPKEWEINSAYIIDPDGKKIVDFSDNNLHIVSYSIPVDMEMDLDELQSYLHSIPEMPTAIPYITSYYNETWGFCLSHNVREKLKPGKYKVFIDSKLKNGSLTYGEIILPGKSKKEVFLSTYVCHPSMANNELSGPSVTSQLAKWLSSRDNYYTYRIIFIPETIGSIVYLSKHLKYLQENVIAGYVVTCVGDERAWSLMPSRKGNKYSDKVARHVLNYMAPDHTEYSFLTRGSDERQYCSPGVDLPVSSIMRSKYVTYPEYHTSLDNLDFVSGKGLGQAFSVYTKVIEVIESDCKPQATLLCEPKMSDRGLRDTLGKRGLAESSRMIMNLLAYADGAESLIDIAEKIDEPAWELKNVLDVLIEHELISIT